MISATDTVLLTAFPLPTTTIVPFFYPRYDLITISFAKQQYAQGSPLTILDRLLHIGLFCLMC
jgi:hypothetical protein